MYRNKSLVIALLAATAHTPLLAQAAPPPEDLPANAGSPPAPEPAASEAEPSPGDAVPAEGEEYEDEEEAIVITGQRERGAVPGDIPPEIQLDRRDIRALGAGSIAELLEAIAPQVSSGRGRGEGQPVLLLNGRRISGFREIRNIPPEAIERVDILPEEVALKYGYRADQKVVNFVLRRRFNAVTAELEGGLPTEGGRSSQEVDLNILRIDDAGRWEIDAEYERETALFESERDLIQAASGPFDLTGNVGSAVPGAEVDPALSALLGQPVTLTGVPASALGGAPALGEFGVSANVTDEARFRTLLPSSEQFSIDGTLSRTIFGNVSATLNASFEQSTSTSLFGLPSAELGIPAGNFFSPFGGDVMLYRAFEFPRPLTRDSRSRTAHAGVALNGDLSGWRWSFTGNYDRVNSLTRTDSDPDVSLIEARIAANDAAFNPFGPIDEQLFIIGPRDRTRSVEETANAEAVASKSLFELPAGEVATTFKLGVEARGFESESLRGGIEQSRDLSRRRAEGQGNIDLPIASRRRDVLSAIGDLSLNANFAIEELSDFGTLTTLGYGFNWEPFEQVRLIASVTEEQGAPSVQQLGNPFELIPNVRVFDFTRGETVDITRIQGGNPGLLADNRRAFKLGLTVKPLEETDLTFTAEYNRSRIRNPIASFPAATPEIEAAFPDRFVRDGEGRLTQIDSRPINFARADTAQVRWGFNFSKPIKSRGGGGGFGGWRGGGPGGWRARAAEGGAAATPPPGAPAATTAPPENGQTPPPASVETGQPGTVAAPTPGAGPAPPSPDNAGGGRPGGGPGGFGGGRGFGRGGQGQGGRLQLALYHTWRLQDQVLIREGVPELDYLEGSASGSRGGRSRHELELQAGIFKNGFGARLTGNWQSGTTVRGAPGVGGGSGSSDLFFSDFTTLNLRLFADLGQQPALVRKHPWLRGTRVSLAVDNLLNNRLDVRDAVGVTPLSYQPGYLDPLGRSVRLTIRKQFLPSRRPREAPVTTP